MRPFIKLLIILVFLFLAGCGDGGKAAPQLFVSQIFSDSFFDGDIERDPFSGALTVTQGNTESVFAGIDPATQVEFRAFLDFPLSGQRGVPINAIIQSATLDIFINSILPQPLSATIPIRIDLVSFQPPTLVAGDFDRTVLPALATTTIVPPISQSDFGQHVTVDVTQLMREAQRLQLANFQLRLLLDLSASQGLIEINDTTGINRSTLAPLLEVTYF